MMEKLSREASPADSIDDDLSAAEEMGLISDHRDDARRRSPSLLDGWTRHTKDWKQRLQKLEDTDIIKRLLVNAVLVALWHCFSLSISIVSSQPPSVRTVGCELTGPV
jgi:hypothetical protein